MNAQKLSLERVRLSIEETRESASVWTAAALGTLGMSLGGGAQPAPVVRRRRAQSESPSRTS